MKRFFLLFILLFIICSISNAQESNRWEEMGNDGKSDIYIDKLTIKKTEGVLRAWRKSIYYDTQLSGYSKKFMYDETISLLYFDCSNDKVKVVETSYRYKDNVVYVHENYDYAEWILAPPESMGEFLLNYVCTYK